jgi:hypothetical protein
VYAELVGQLGDHVDALVHGLTELLGDPRTLVAYDGAPMLTATAGGAP